MSEEQQQPLTGTLLFIDDEENILSALRRLFRPLGYRILIANRAMEGLAIMEREEVDLIICDMRMPEMGGDEFFAQASQKWPDTMRILLTGYADIASTIAAINKGNIYSYISKPWEDSDLKFNVQRALEQRLLKAERRQLTKLTQQQNEELTTLNATLEQKVMERTKELSKTMEQLEGTHESLKKSYSDSIKMFSSIIELRGGRKPGRARRVADMGFKLSVTMGVEKAAQDILFACLLSDIGRLGLSDDLLAKPFDSLSKKEREIIVSHAMMGEGLFMSLDLLHGAASLISARYERYDGSGFPSGLKGEDIPLGACILSVVDDYDALQTGALLEDKLTASQAEQFIIKNQGKRYSPRVVDAFVKYLTIEKKKSTKIIRYVDADKLKSGMVLGKDLVTADGMVLLAKGHQLDSALIEKICRLSNIAESGTGLYIEMKE